MAVFERPTSPRVLEAANPFDSTREREFIVTDAATADEAIAEALTTAGDTIEKPGFRLVYDHAECEGIESADDDIWRVVLFYAVDITEIDLPREFTFDTSGGTYHIQQSLRTAFKWRDSAGTPDNSGKINTDAEGSVKGVDVVIPQASFTETRAFSEGEVNSAFKLRLYQFVGTVNITTFQDCAPGECLFMGATGQGDASGDWTITYQFAYSQNATYKFDVNCVTVQGEQHCEEINVQKAGWDYLWLQYSKDADANGLKPRLEGIYVEEVYRRKDLNQLFTRAR